MAVRVLLVLAAFALLYGCALEESPVEKQEQAARAEGSAPQPLPDQSSQDAALQTYFDQMSTLLLDKGLNGAGGAKGDREVRTLARMRTLAALERLDPARKRLIMQFLVEANLVQNAPGKEPVIGLVGADLSGVDLTGSVLYDANLSGANLSNATGKTAEQLDGQAGSLEGAIMPDGRKYEDWLKDEESGG
jgi:uncharacterized protein YjbI with pentapeptide repeats